MPQVVRTEERSQGRLESSQDLPTRKWTEISSSKGPISDVQDLAATCTVRAELNVWNQTQHYICGLTGAKGDRILHFLSQGIQF